MAVVLITGSNGQLGSELKAASKSVFGHNFIFTDVDKLDITDGETTRDYIAQTKPDWIINCAAYNAVDRAESDPDNAYMVNALAVKNIVSVIRDTPCRLVHFSSDYVFDGKSSVPYIESARTNPLSVYGKSKLEGEKYALLHPLSMVIRTSWLHSAYGNNFVKTIIRAGSEKDRLRVVNDQTGSPTYASDLASAVLNIIMKVNDHQIAFNEGIYHYTNEGTCTWYEFACAIKEEAGFNAAIEAVTTAEYGSAAPRPAWSVMSTKKITDNYRIAVPHWRTSLRKCIRQIKNN